MGRAGGGSRSGGSRSSGSRSSSRSSGSHRSSSSSRSYSSSSRAGRSSSSSWSGSSGSRSYHSSSRTYGGYNPPPRTHGGFGGPPPMSHGPVYSSGPAYSNYRRAHYRGSGGCFSSFLTALVILLIIMTVVKGASFISTPRSTIERTRLESGLSYDKDVVLLDETDWIEWPDSLGKDLKDFWDETGVQPYIIMLDYDKSLKTDSDKEKHAETLYDQYIDREDALLFVYYGEEDLEGEVGLMCHVIGKQATSVFDSEAIELWYNSIDKYWYDFDLSMTDVYRKAYINAAETIMKHPTTIWDAVKVSVILLTILIIVKVIASLAMKSMERSKEKAAETERILKASMDSLSQDKTSGDDLLDKYTT